VDGNNRRNRGQVLRLLQESGSDGLTPEGLAAVFRNAGKHGAADRIGEIATYLQDKGYVRIELIRDPISGVKREVVRLTARGTDLLEGSLDDDPGVICVR
jgi:hypothetical protein